MGNATADLVRVAVIEYPNWRDEMRRVTPAARRWAREHPDADGYVVFVDSADDIMETYGAIWGGGAFYVVKDGVARGASAIECVPSAFHHRRG